MSEYYFKVRVYSAIRDIIPFFVSEKCTYMFNSLPKTLHNS